ncbi:CPBP family intramembrane metalloprotease [Clostridium estertheticum]|uniref:CPBP family intramembrane glutamic endopeptidase n=1 Tax=Clostridium estertheticum TaxID=238834 RepID=UPI001C7D6F4E|nr:CPBP family intramembrane glutamic endopeptidase [Clostridium estertheticum]MBX4258341.1 CPBP family intramembrane metalloprotease [Clostridium estertheticum]WLC69697.1 CPBP family intramembrane metalloprotease [Clostridium estertheticum]
MEKYIKQLLIPILWEGLFIVSCVFLPKEYFIYTNFLFYFGIIIFFVQKGYFNLKELKANITSGKKFWFPVALTVLFLILAFIVSYVPKMFFPNLDEGMIGLERNNWLTLILFAISTIIFPPLAEELFYRKAMISFQSKKILFISTIISMLLYALEHSLSLYGISMAMIWAIPFSISYIKTKNIYIPMTAHFIVNLIMNGSSVIITALHFLR